jgi:inorganic triphosphatase YgiF
VIEIEAKFCVPDSQVYAQLERLETLAGCSLSNRRVIHIEDTYLDTRDWLLLRSGYSLRRRVTAGSIRMTLKGLSAGEGAVHRREEIELLLDSRTPPASWPRTPLRARVLGMVGEESLFDLFTVRQERRTREVLCGSRLVGELCLDAVRMATRDGDCSYYELEMELATLGSEDDLQRIVTALQGSLALTPEPRSKFERGLNFYFGPSVTSDLLRRAGHQ